MTRFAVTAGALPHLPHLQPVRWARSSSIFNPRGPGVLGPTTALRRILDVLDKKENSENSNSDAREILSTNREVAGNALEKQYRKSCCLGKNMRSTLVPLVFADFLSSIVFVMKSLVNKLKLVYFVHFVHLQKI